MRYIFISLVIFSSFACVSSQEYFQQEVNYKISVSLNDTKHELNAFESVEYINNSPDTLRFLYFHLWPNAYSGNNTALAKQIFALQGKQNLFNDPELRGSIDSLNFTMEGEPLQWNLLPENPDICKILLNKPLLKGDTIVISTPFKVKIPKGVTSLLGHIGESYQISQWYPKPAVYDKNGWHQMPYLDQGELYSEFGNYDVSITLPSNYIVAATGNLQTDSEKVLLDSLAGDNNRMKIADYGLSGFPLSSTRMKTIRYLENEVHDFVWFADKRFLVQKGSVTLPGSGKEVTTWAMYTRLEALLWNDAIEYINSAILHFSQWIGDYPYNNFIAVQSALSAGAGMEYPGVTVIGPTDDPFLLDLVIAHEICHSWFYSSIASDERRYPYMDESITSAFESRYMEERYPGKKLWEVTYNNKKLAEFLQFDEMPIQLNAELDRLIQARMNKEQPADLPAQDYSSDNYNIIIYNKAAQGFTYLRAYLGDTIFDEIIRNYYIKWKNKHPQPDDLRKLFEEGTEKDLNWFFDDFLGTTKRLDYKLVRLKDNELLIKNRGELIGPFHIAETIGDSIISERWEEGFAGQKWFPVSKNKYETIIIDPENRMPELYRLNNNISTSGIMPHKDPFQLHFLFTVEDPSSRSLIFIPVADWNSEDKFMVGLALHNGKLLPKPFEYFIIPFYKFSNSGLTGYGKLSFNVIPDNNIIRRASFILEGTQFGAPGNQNYQKIKTGFDFQFRPQQYINPVVHNAFGYYIAASDLQRIRQLEPTKLLSYLQIGYGIKKTGLVNPSSILFLFESGSSYQKASLEINYTLSYPGNRNGLDLRLFAGKMLRNNSAYPFYMFSSVGRGGREEYFYQGLYPNRFEEFPKTFWSRQMTLSEGGLITPLIDSLGYNNWVCSFTLTSSLPGRASVLPLKPFVNIVLNDYGIGITGKSGFFFEAGFKTGVWDFVELYIPLLVSENIDSVAGTIRTRIRFVFKLDIFNKIRI